MEEQRKKQQEGGGPQQPTSPQQTVEEISIQTNKDKNKECK